MASIDKDSSFLLTHFSNLASQRTTTLNQVPFILGLRNNPPALRRVIELIMATTLNWTVTDVTLAMSPYTILSSDAVLLVETSTGGAGTRTLNLPALVAGRAYFIKDIEGNASTNNIVIKRNGSDTVEDGSQNLIINADFGGLLIIGGNGTEWYVLATM